MTASRENDDSEECPHPHSTARVPDWEERRYPGLREQSQIEAGSSLVIQIHLWPRLLVVLRQLKGSAGHVRAAEGYHELEDAGDRSGFWNPEYMHGFLDREGRRLLLPLHWGLISCDTCGDGTWMHCKSSDRGDPHPCA